jgi:hypothetical protein
MAGRYAMPPASDRITRRAGARGLVQPRHADVLLRLVSRGGAVGGRGGAG